MGLGYVEHSDGVTAEFVSSGSYQIRVAGEIVPARASLRPMYDPAGERVRM
jgi:sarcosine dehydrogenase